MATVVRMPAALAGETEGAIQTWLAEVGQTVAVGEPLAEIETEKAVVEYAAEVEGTVVRLLAEPGSNLAVGEPIAVILAPGEDEAAAEEALAAAGISGAGGGSGTASPSEAPGSGASEGQKPGEPEPDGAEPAAPEPTVTDAPAAPEPETAPPGAEEAAPAPAADTGGDTEPAEPTGAGSGADRRFASPIVRRLARERGISLDRVVGTGPGGRIVRRDLDALPERTPDAAPAAEAPAAAAPTGAGERSAAGYTDVPLNGMRRAIARRLTESKSTVPHFYVTADCRVDALLELRRSVNQTAQRKISVNDFVIKAVAGALLRVPQANAIWNGDSIRQFDGVDIAVAVSVPNGLLTPVLRGVDQLPLSAISASVAELAERARAGRLKQHELEGGSFAVSNMGMYGVDEFSAILNPPQSGILAVGAAKQRPVVEDGQLAVGSVMTVTLSADHRVVDGAVGAEWMAAFVELIEHPLGMLI